jgi:hypothetical protein
MYRRIKKLAHWCKLISIKRINKKERREHAKKTGVISFELLFQFL